VSGLDEVGTRLIPIPSGYKKGIIPEYWMGKNARGESLCWLQQQIPKRQAHFKKDFIINLAHNKEWDEVFFNQLVTIECLGPYGFSRNYDTDSDFVNMVVEEMRRVFTKTGVATS
jgi:hypothetical protein